MSQKISCDIFCTVIDNYGDIGVCWRLARQLANEYDVAVRLWVDDLAALKQLCPDVDVALAQQLVRGVDVRHWSVVFPEIEVAQLVIESFACELPGRYVEAMAKQKIAPVWINLEYLSAEDWIEGCHKLPSPHPRLPLVKYFFFPGFTSSTGGLLLERGLLAMRDAFQGDAQAIAQYWNKLGVPVPMEEELRISLFSYENSAMPGLMQAWELGTYPVTCLVPEGKFLPQVSGYFGILNGQPGDVWQRGSLSVRVLPFVEQERFDQLLWACDLNFVRGEDSFVRAQWAGQPFVWHIYPQHDGVHMHKLHAFMGRYCAGLAPETASALSGFWECWNGAQGIEQAWNKFQRHLSTLRQQSRGWSRQLAENNLALNLLDFFREIGRMRDFENQQQE